MSLDSTTVLARIRSILHVGEADELVVKAFANRYGTVEQLDSALYGLAPVITHPIVGLYQIVFDRAPDDAGLRHWVGKLTADAIVPSNDISLTQIVAEFATSDEWRAIVEGKSNAQIVTALYHQALGRPPEQAGLDFWVAELDKGRLPTDLILEFASSDEFIARATPHIEGYLRGNEAEEPAGHSLFDVPPEGRTVDAPLDYDIVKGRIADILRFEASYHLVDTFRERYASLDELDAALLDFAAVTVTPVIGLYQAAFNRVPDAEGLTFWRGQLGESGIDLFDPDVLRAVAREFVASAEWQAKVATLDAQDIVKLLYQQALGREGEDAGVDFWTNLLEDDPSAAADLLVQFVLSDEFINSAAPHFDTLLLSAARGTLPEGGPLFGVVPYTLVDGVFSLTLAGSYALTETADGAALHLLGTSHIITAEIIDGIDEIQVPEGFSIDIAGALLDGRQIVLGAGAGHAGAIDITGVTITGATPDAPVSVDPDLSGVSIPDGGPAVTVNGNVGDWFIARWATLDAAYGQIGQIEGGQAALFGNYTDDTALPEGTTVLGESTLGEAALAVNKAFVALAADYADYLDNDGAPLTDFIAKAGETRSQLIHDNLLGNGSDASLAGRNFPADVETALRQLLPDWVEERPVVSGHDSDAFNAAHRQALAIDWEKGFERPDYARAIDQGTIDAIGIRDGNQPHFGSGNSPDSYAIERHEGAGVEVGLKVHFRQGSDIAPEGPSGDDGIVIFEVSAGHQQAGVGGAPATREDLAAWSFDFSVLTGINGQDTTLDDFQFTLKIDIDPSAATNFVVLELGGANGNTPWFVQGTTTGFIPDQEVGTTPDNDALISQNSLNFGFDHLRELIETDGDAPYDFGPGRFDIILSAATRGEDSVELVSTHVVVNVVGIAEAEAPELLGAA